MTRRGETKVLHVGLSAGAYNLDPLTAQDVDSMFVLRQIVEAPFTNRTGTAELEPALFTTELQRDPASPNSWRSQLHPDLVYSDGTPVTAAEVVECLSKVALFREQATAEARGDDIVFHLSRPNPRFEVTLSHPLCSIHRWKGNRLLGTGAYQLASDTTSEAIHLVRNPFHRAEVPIDEVWIRAFPREHGKHKALVKAIQNGEVHFTNALARDEIDPLTGVRKSFSPGISTALLFFNTESPKLRDPRVRRALAFAIDRIEVAGTAYRNKLAFAAPSLLPRALGPADDGLSYDLARAREILGLPDVTMPDRLTMLMMWAPRPYLPYPERYRDAIAEMLGKIGVEVVPVSTTSSLDFGKRIIAGTEDVVLGGWVADVIDAADFLEANLASNRVPTEENISVSTNCGRLRSAEMDRALATYRAERTTESLEDVMQVLTKEAPLVPLAYGPSAAVFSTRVLGFKPSPISTFPLSQLDLAP